MKNLRIGVVGVGHIGSNHARLYAEIPSADFTAVYDVDPFRSRTIGGKFGATPAKSLDEFIEMVDAASVATPTNTHYAIARALLAKGKHVLVEKPITDNTAHATELAELAARGGLILQVGHVERFNPVLGALETYLTHPRFIEAHRLSPYSERSTDIGVVLDLICILCARRSGASTRWACRSLAAAKTSPMRDSILKMVAWQTLPPAASVPSVFARFASFKRTPISRSITKIKAAKSTDGLGDALYAIESISNGRNRLSFSWLRSSNARAQDASRVFRVLKRRQR
jgi:NAD-dependent oxidoreductase involved in siderophore biosynthesis